MERIYLDYAATTPTDPQVARAMQPFFTEEFGNPSSIHSFGQEARKAMERAREILASFINAKTDEIIFTSGGTESNNMAVFGVADKLKDKGKHIITSKIEHHAIIEPCKFLEKHGYKVTYLPVDKTGLVDSENVKKAITKETVLISIMHANNEIGTIEPIEEIAKIAHEHNIYMHSDAVQTVGHIPLDVDKLGVDLLSLSAHKFYGPKGIGALYVRKGTKISPYLHGGDQERGRRASTSNVSGIVGLGEAIELCQSRMDKEVKFQIELRERLISQIPKMISEVQLNGHPTKRLPNNVNFIFSFIEGESILLNLDMLGIAASTGSACTSSSLEPSHVLLAIGLPHELAHGSLRVTFGRWTKKEHIDYLLDHLPKIVDKLRRMSPLYEPR